MADKRWPKDDLDLHITGAVLLPNDHTDFCESARMIFAKFKETGRYFNRGDVMAHLTKNGLQPVTTAAFRSQLDGLGVPVMARVLYKDKLALIPKRCSDDSAKALMQTQDMREILPKIRLVTQMPIVVPDGNTVKILDPGYHEDQQVLVTGKDKVEQVPYESAVEPVLDLLKDFDFPTPGDKARAIAEIMTPALRMGGHLEGPAPVHGAEADASQSGKTLRQEMTRCIYGETGYMVAQRNGGVGSFDESLAAGLLSGKPFVVMDNIRGKVDSPFWEAAITWGETVSVRVPHSGEVQVDATRINFQLSSNGIEVPRDMANRMSITRIRHQKPGYPFTRNRSELLALARKDRCKYLGCIFAIIKHWAEAGRQKLPNVPHDFQEWAGPLAWIVQECFGVGPLMEAHVDAQNRVSDPALSWLRNVCIAAARSTLVDQELLASRMKELCESEGIDIPGLTAETNDEVANKHIGKILGRCFRSGDELSVDGFIVHRTESTDDHGTRRRQYRISRTGVIPAVPLSPLSEKRLGKGDLSLEGYCTAGNSGNGESEAFVGKYAGDDGGPF